MFSFCQLHQNSKASCIQRYILLVFLRYLSIGASFVTIRPSQQIFNSDAILVDAFAHSWCALSLGGLPSTVIYTYSWSGSLGESILPCPSLWTLISQKLYKQEYWDLACRSWASCAAQVYISRVCHADNGRLPWLS